MSDVTPVYVPGDQVNGFYLASDYRWYPVAQPPVVVQQRSSAAVWIIAVLVALVTIPVWIWFTPLILVGLLVWSLVLVVRSFGWRGGALMVGVLLLAGGLSWVVSAG